MTSVVTSSWSARIAPRNSKLPSIRSSPLESYLLPQTLLLRLLEFVQISINRYISFHLMQREVYRKIMPEKKGRYVALWQCLIGSLAKARNTKYFLIFQQKNKSRKLEEMMDLLDREIKRTDTLLYQMIPREVADALRSGQPAMSTCRVLSLY